MSPTDIAAVTALRAQLWHAGFRPVPVFNADATVTSPGKQPLGTAWQRDARRDPPFCATSPAVAHALNTGVLGDGLRPIDFDIDDPAIARRCRAIAAEMFGEAPVRMRKGSPRSLALYRAEIGEPAKRTLTGSSHATEHACKIEVLGHGQQFVAFGTHASGADLEWFPAAPGQELRDRLPAVTEDQIQAFLEACAPILDAPMPINPRGNGQEHASADPQADLLRIAAALTNIPNAGPADWEAWNRIGMAVWRATGGTSAGWEAFNAWSARNGAYDLGATRARWDHFATSPPTSIGAGTIFHMAAEAGRRQCNSKAEPPEGDNRANAEPHDDAFFNPWADPPPPEFPGGVVAIRDGVCPGGLAMAHLTAASGAAPKGSRFKPYLSGVWSVPPIVWTMLIAESGQRKTAIENLAFFPLHEVHTAVWVAHQRRIRAWQALSSDEQHSTPRPEEPHSFMVEDITPEKLQMVLSATDRGTFMSRDEMAGLLEFGRYSKGTGAAERAFYLQAYEGGTYTVGRASRPTLHITVNALTLYGSIQPDRLKDFPDLAKDGLLQRINMIRASLATASRDNVSVKGVDKINAAITGLTRRENRRYTTTPDGGEIVRQTEQDGRSFATITDYGPGFQGTCSKLHGTHARYALVLHMLDDPDNEIIPTATVERARILVREFLLPQARDFFAILAGSQQQRLRDAAGWILTKAPQRFLASDVTAGVRACRGMGTKALSDLLDPLVAGGWLEPETPFPSNRAWKLHPYVRVAFADRAATECARREVARALVTSIGSRS